MILDGRGGRRRGLQRPLGPTRSPPRIAVDCFHGDVVELEDLSLELFDVTLMRSLCIENELLALLQRLVMFQLHGP